ncbi:MAG: DUF4783 domain-containing protein [Saprospiraceae bacterium]|nr:DUF4783 domain-containing protein [Saprospiraceae bacterium]
MKNVLNTILFCFLFIWCNALVAQSAFDALESGNYAAIAKKMAPEVNIQVDRNKKLVPKERAIQMLRIALEDFDPIEWEVLHRGASEADDDKYMIAALTNESGEGIRLFLQIEKYPEGPRISSVRIRKAL